MIRKVCAPKNRIDIFMLRKRLTCETKESTGKGEPMLNLRYVFSCRSLYRRAPKNSLSCYYASSVQCFYAANVTTNIAPKNYLNFQFRILLDDD